MKVDINDTSKKGHRVAYCEFCTTKGRIDIVRYDSITKGGLKPIPVCIDCQIGCDTDMKEREVMVDLIVKDKDAN